MTPALTVTGRDVGPPRYKGLANFTTPAPAGERAGDAEAITHSKDWYVLHIQPRADQSAARQLEQDGFEVFFPKTFNVTAAQGTAAAPLFPGYLFLRCDRHAAGRIHFSAAHRVAGWVNFNGVAPAVPDQVIQQLKERVECLNQSGGLWRRFQPGQKVSLLAGKLEALAEVVEAAASPQQRVKVLLHFLGRMVQAQVPWQALHPVEQAGLVPQRLPRRTRGRGRWTKEFR
ncbi:MAG: hypothetical protein FJ316_06940 [SAR202 cluster bacterium]|nr:hypothetical protein [SAR202 cluster bacterium]